MITAVLSAQQNRKNSIYLFLSCSVHLCSVVIENWFPSVYKPKSIQTPTMKNRPSDLLSINSKLNLIPVPPKWLNINHFSFRIGKLNHIWRTKVGILFTECDYPRSLMFFCCGFERENQIIIAGNNRCTANVINVRLGKENRGARKTRRVNKLEKHGTNE